jgi:hypothetical protein
MINCLPSDVKGKKGRRGGWMRERRIKRQEIGCHFAVIKKKKIKMGWAEFKRS